MSTVVVSSGYGRDRREVELVPGRRYVVSPLNPNKKKHAGRYCVLLDGFDGFMPEWVPVRYESTGRRGRVDVSDLLPAGDEGKSDFRN